MPKRPNTAPADEQRLYLLPGERSLSDPALPAPSPAQFHSSSSHSKEEGQTSYDWGTFIAAYAHGHWDPHRTPRPPRPPSPPVVTQSSSAPNAASSSTSQSATASIGHIQPPQHSPPQTNNSNV